MIYNSIIGNETLDMEFKEFFLITHSFTDKKIKYIVQNKKICNIPEFIKDVNYILQSYFYKYFPKYISSFNNSNINGQLCIGISNNGNLIGVPHNNLNKTIILQMLFKCEHLLNINKSVFNKLMDYIDIQIIELTLNSEILLTKQNESYEFINNSNKKSYLEQIKYSDKMNEKAKHITHINKYRCKIEKVVTDLQLKKECKQFIAMHCNDKIEIDRLQLEMDTIDPYFELTIDRIKQYKYTKSHVIYWITTFRDFYTDYYSRKLSLQKKKTFNKKILNNNPYIKVFKDMKKLIPLIISDNNKSLKSYVIIIKLKQFFDFNILYKEHSAENGHDKWILTRRIIDHLNQPISDVNFKSDSDVNFKSDSDVNF
jgi:hypothetical protein